MDGALFSEGISGAGYKQIMDRELFGLDSGTSLQNAKHPLGVIELAFDTESNLLPTDLVLSLRAPH